MAKTVKGTEPKKAPIKKVDGKAKAAKKAAKKAAYEASVKQKPKKESNKDKVFLPPAKNRGILKDHTGEIIPSRTFKKLMEKNRALTVAEYRVMRNAKLKKLRK